MTRPAYLYKVTDLLNGKAYIGVTYNVRRRLAAHKRKTPGMENRRQLLKLAMCTSGVDNFSTEVLCIGSRAYCHELEMKAIVAFNTLEPNGYNVTKGGLGSLGVTGKRSGTWGRTGALHPLYNKPGVRTGIPHSEETKAKMRAARLGVKHSDEAKEKMRQIALNRSPEVKARMAQGRLTSKKKDGLQ